MVDGKTFGSTLWRFRNFFFIVVPALAVLPLPLLVEGQESKCGYVMIIMAIYWCTEAVPLAVTAMIPIFLMPFLGLLKTDDIVILYMQETTMMFSGGLMVALAIEKCNLHKRMALGILLMVGVKPLWLTLGFILPTWFLSMWISNTATTSMMLPILEAVLDKLGHIGTDDDEVDDQVDGVDNQAMDDISTHEKITMETKFGGEDQTEAEVGSSASGSTSRDDDTDKPQNGDVPQYDNTTHFKSYSALDFDVKEFKKSSFDLPSVKDLPNDNDSSYHDDGRTPEQRARDLKRYTSICKGMTLAVAYGANIGGTGTLTGTTPNIIMKDAADSLWQEKGYLESPVNFASYMVYSAPSALITIIFVWLWLVLLHMGPRSFLFCRKLDEHEKRKEKTITDSIRKDFKALGRMKYDEWFVLVVFLGMIMLWFFRSPGFVAGWGDQMKTGYIKDSVTSMMCVVILFVLPNRRPRWGSEKQHGKVDTLLDWDIINSKFPWSVIFLVGGGMALAEAAEGSGLSDLIGDALTVFDVLPLWFMSFILALITSMLTEVTSNTATCTLIMPIVAKMAENLGINPLYLMFPCALATSYAFMLPVATPPNAIAFSYNRVTVLDMVKAGLPLKLTIFVLTLATETWGKAYFNLDVLPWDPSNSTNITSYQMLKETLHPQMTLLD